MKKTIIAICIALLAMAPLGLAVDQEKGITKNGVSQGTLVTIIKTHETLLNELAADHDADNATVAELVTDHDADNDILGTYETLIEEIAVDMDANNDILGTYETLIEELATDHDANNDELDLVVTLLTELKTDMDANNGEVDTAITLQTELIADHDADNDVMDDLKTLVNELQDAYNESVVQHGNIAITAAPEKYKSVQEINAVLKGFPITKAAQDNLTFTAADTINVGTAVGDYWGIWKVELGLDGTFYTHSPAADQTYANEAAAIAALPATTANRVDVGYITVQANSDVAWTANTDDMTPASDCQAANFTDVTEVSQLTAVSSSPAADLAAGAMSAFAADITAATPTGFAADLAATHPVSTVAADLTATHPVATVAADLTATASAADLSADSSVGSGTTSDPSVSLTD